MDAKKDHVLFAINYLDEPVMLEATGALDEAVRDDTDGLMRDLDDCEHLPTAQGIWVVEMKKLGSEFDRDDFMEELRHARLRRATLLELGTYAGVK